MNVEEHTEEQCSKMGAPCSVFFHGLNLLFAEHLSEFKGISCSALNAVVTSIGNGC